MRLRRISSALLLALCAGAVAIAQQSTTTTGTFTGVERRITTDLADQFDPVISGDLIVYTDNRGADLDVYYFDLATGQEKQVTGSGQHEQLTDVSNGQIVYNLLSTSDVVLFATSNNSHSNLTESIAGASMNPAIGSNLVAWEELGWPSKEVFAMDVTTGEVRNLSNIAGQQSSDRRDGEPAVGDGVIVWQSCFSLCDIWAYDWTAANAFPVVATSADERRPDVNGGKIAYEAVVDGQRDIFVYDIATGATTQLSLPGNQVNPAISGNVISFEDTVTGTYHVKLWKFDTGEVFDLTSLPGGPPPSAGQYLNDIDGNRVVYTDDRGGQLDIYMFEFSFEQTDTTPPTIALGGCPAAPVLLGSTHTVDVLVSDTESDVATQSQPNGPVSLDTSTVGAHTFTVDATDNAGNVAPQAVCAYQVIYDFVGAGGFLSPVADFPAVNSAKAGSAVPVKFQLPNGSGGFISDLTAVTGITVGQVGSFGTLPATEIEEWVTGESGLKYDPLAQQYVYVWKTDRAMAGLSYVLTLRLNDGTEHTANFSLK